MSIDDDTVDESDPRRQTPSSPADTGRSRAEAAVETPKRLSPDAGVLPSVLIRGIEPRLLEPRLRRH